MFRGHKNEVQCVSWHPHHEGMFASGGGDGSIFFWEVGNDMPIGQMDKAHESCVALSILLSFRKLAAFFISRIDIVPLMMHTSTHTHSLSFFLSSSLLLLLLLLLSIFYFLSYTFFLSFRS